jgi:hypothetical protein
MQPDAKNSKNNRQLINFIFKQPISSFIYLITP